MRGNRELYERLVRDFALNYEVTAAEIKYAIEANYLQEAHKQIHNLKGLAGNLSATRLQASAAALESVVKDTEADHAERLARFAEFEKAMNQALDSARALVSPDPSRQLDKEKDQTQLNAKTAEKLAARLRKACELGDVSTLTAIAEKLPAESYYASEINRLAESFEFDGLLKLADELESQTER